MNGIHCSRRHSMKLLASVAATAAFAGCGGGVGGEADTAVSEDVQEALRANKRVVLRNHGPNVVSIWNEIAFTTASVPASTGGATPEERVAGPDVTTVQLAVYDAVIAIARTHKPHAITPTTQAHGADPDAMQAAAIEAAYRVLKGLFPNRGVHYEAAYASGMAALPDSSGKTIGRQIGAEVAAGMLALRANDGRETVLAPYVPGTLPGQFRGINPINRIGPHIRPFVTLSHSQFRAAPPYALRGHAYAVDLNEVKVMASRTGSARTAAQEEIARFYTEPPGGFYARNLRQFATASSSLADNARLLAMLWVAQTDAVTACFETKYHYNFWRPTSAIRLADTDNNPATDPDPLWEPVVTTPNHPEYPAAHSCNSAAIAEIVRYFYGTRNVVFEMTSTATGTTHRFERTDDMVHETSDGRVWGGMHFRTSTAVGARQAKEVVNWLTNNYFCPY